ncbi:MAG TPA: helical backbone metal receptor [Thermoanaerobaculia bacterium]|nr:helical backbone metal receptor [Thermoanaerobaculia bacterium]
MIAAADRIRAAAPLRSAWRRPAARAAGVTLALALAAGGGIAAPPPPVSCQRVVALSPSAVELLFALGLGERVVGVSDYATWPPAAAALPRLGGLFDPRLETLVALRPDLAVLLPSQRELGGQLQRLGVPVLEVASDAVEDVPAAAAALGARCAATDAARELRRQWRRDLAPDPVPGTPLVLLVLDRPQGELGRILAAGPGTFYDQLLARLGARNALADAALPYPQASLEELLRRRPEVIVELQSRPLHPAAAAALSRDWQRVPGLRDARVEVISGSHVMVPGPRLPRLYRELREALAR